MNLLEKAKESINYYDKSGGHIGLVGEDYIRLCRALVEAMEEMELKSNKYRGIIGLGDEGIEDALDILRKHLEVEK